MVGTRSRRTLGIALLAAVTGLGLLAKPPFGAAQSSRGADGARLLKGALDLHFHMDPWTLERVRGAGIAEVLAAVQSIASQTLRQSGSLGACPDYRDGWT